jgi:hypothetical protein
METSTPGWFCQRARDWCEPGLNTRRKILPEPQAEPGRKSPAVGAPGIVPPLPWDAGIEPNDGSVPGKAFTEG